MNKILLVASILFCQRAYAQQNTFNYKLKINKIDTLEEKRKMYDVKFDWLDSSTTVQQWKPFAIDSIDILGAKKFAKAAKLAYKAPDSSWAKFHINQTQNCYVNSQEHLLSYNGIDASVMFNAKTTIGIEDFKKILNSIYLLNERIPTKPKKNLKKTFPDNSLIVFRNKSNWPIHAMFHNAGVYYSKYGASSFKEETSLKVVFEHYWDTVFIEVYELDWEKLTPYLEEI